jgi:hypothetical protein
MPVTSRHTTMSFEEFRLLQRDPGWKQRHGLAAALVSWSLRALLGQGEGTLRSRYLLANEPSRRWHQRFGFTLDRDPRETDVI